MSDLQKKKYHADQKKRVSRSRGGGVGKKQAVSHRKKQSEDHSNWKRKRKISPRGNPSEGMPPFHP